MKIRSLFAEDNEKQVFLLENVENIAVVGSFEDFDQQEELKKALVTFYDVKTSGALEHEDTNDDDTVFNLLQKNLPAPSSFGKAWYIPQKKLQIRCHRPSGESGTPATLISPILADFYSNLQNPDLPVAKIDVIAARQLTEICSNHHDDEKQLTKALDDWCQESNLGSWNSCGIGNDSSRLSTTADGHLALLVNREDKLGMGTGGDAYMQNSGYYVKFWTAHRPIWKQCCCPSILIENVGSHISISGAVWTDRPIVDPFFSTSLLYDQHDRPRMDRIARMVTAIRKAIDDLRQYYNGINAMDVKLLRNHFPYYNGDDDIFFCYERSLKDLVYLARQESTKELIVVKFTRTYSAEAHQVAQKLDTPQNSFFVESFLETGL